MKEYLKMSDVFKPGVGSSVEIRFLNGVADRNEAAKYIKHACDSHDELVAEVARLRKAVELASMTLDEVDRVMTERIKNGAYDLDDISAEVEGAINRLSDTE